MVRNIVNMVSDRYSASMTLFNLMISAGHIFSCICFMMPIVGLSRLFAYFLTMTMTMDFIFQSSFLLTTRATEKKSPLTRDFRILRYT